MPANHDPIAEPYQRMIRRRGAARLVGADLSEERIDLARRQEDVEHPPVSFLECLP